MIRVPLILIYTVVFWFLAEIPIAILGSVLPWWAKRGVWGDVLGLAWIVYMIISFVVLMRWVRKSKGGEVN